MVADGVFSQRFVVTGVRAVAPRRWGSTGRWVALRGCRTWLAWLAGQVLKSTRRCRDLAGPGPASARRMRSLRPPRTMPPAAENSRSRLGTQRRAPPVRTSSWVQAAAHKRARRSGTGSCSACCRGAAGCAARCPWRRGSGPRTGPSGGTCRSGTCLDHCSAARLRRLWLDCQTHATELERNEFGVLWAHLHLTQGSNARRGDAPVSASTRRMGERTRLPSAD